MSNGRVIQATIRTKKTFPSELRLAGLQLHVSEANHLSCRRDEGSLQRQGGRRGLGSRSQFSHCLAVRSQPGVCLLGP